MLATIQNLDPPGVGARDLRECLLLQLKEAGLEQSVPYRLVRDCFEELINHRWSEISKRFGISAARRAEGRRRDREARSQAGPRSTAHASDNYIIPDLIVEKIDGKYHVFLNDANLPRLKLSTRLPGDRARQEEVRGREQGVHLQQAELRQLDDPGDRAAPADDAQGDELHRRPAARVLREGRAVPQAAHAARGRRSDQHARVDGEPRDEREVRADAARRAAAQVLLLVGPLDHRRRRRLGARHQGADPEAGRRTRIPSTRSPIRRSSTSCSESGVQIARRTVAKYRDQLGVLSARMRKRV